MESPDGASNANPGAPTSSRFFSALESGLERPAMLVVGTPDSQMARDGLTGGIPACDGDCAQVLTHHIESIRSLFEN